MTDGVSIILAKAIGAIAGAGLSITFILPHTKREAAIRFFCGAFVGLVFGDTAVENFEKFTGAIIAGHPLQKSIAGAFLAAFVAWYLLGVIAKWARKAEPPSGKQE